MAGKTYKARGLVLRKTKLAEKDLIVTLLDETGALVRVVAKGARKPGGSYAARLELFTTVDLVLAQGRSLDVVTGASLVAGAGAMALGVEQAACASALAELLAAMAQEGLAHERLFPMAKAAFDGMARGVPLQALSLSCSAMLKALAYAGFRPSFSTCVQCGAAIDFACADGVMFSIPDGGAVCAACRPPSDAMKADVALVRWADSLMRSRFEDVLSFPADAGALFSVLQLIRQWTRVHVGKNLKSVDFLLTCGLF